MNLRHSRSSSIVFASNGCFFSLSQLYRVVHTPPFLRAVAMGSKSALLRYRR
jgi:hypothetical protein